MTTSDSRCPAPSGAVPDGPDGPGRSTVSVSLPLTTVNAPVVSPWSCRPVHCPGSQLSSHTWRPWASSSRTAKRSSGSYRSRLRQRCRSAANSSAVRTGCPAAASTGSGAIVLSGTANMTKRLPSESWTDLIRASPRRGRTGRDRRSGVSGAVPGRSAPRRADSGHGADRVRSHTPRAGQRRHGHVRHTARAAPTRRGPLGVGARYAALRDPGTRGSDMVPTEPSRAPAVNRIPARIPRSGTRARPFPPPCRRLRTTRACGRARAARRRRTRDRRPRDRPGASPR